MLKKPRMGKKIFFKAALAKKFLLHFLYRYFVAVYVFEPFLSIIFGKMHRQKYIPEKAHKKAGGQGLKISFTRLDFWHFLDYYRLQ